MRTVSYRLADVAKVTIALGHVAENDATRVQIDAGQIFAEYPDAVPSLTLTNPDSVSYPAVVVKDGNNVIWDVKDSDLAVPGTGEFQLTFTDNGTVVKSCIGKTKICRSIVGEGPAPDPVQDWIDRAEDVLEEIETAFPEGGTTGQVLAKKSDADFDTEWVDQGGGVSDYDELTNRPQIGGTTLTGNKSLSDLGIASASDVSAKYTKPASGIPASDIAAGVIPDPTSIILDTAGSGDTDKVWSASKTDSEVSSVKSALQAKYEKPSGGIPSTDLASGVTDSLALANSAYQKPSGGIPLTDLASNVTTVSGSTPSITGVAGFQYICGECSTLSITVPSSGCIDVLFESGSTATVLTVTPTKTGVSAIKWANGFDPTSLDANTTYEINILDGELGVGCSWT